MNQSYAFALIISSAISALVAAMAWRRRTAPGAAGLTLAMASLIAWALPYAVRWLMQDVTWQYFWLDATYLGVVTAPTAFLIFALQVTNHAEWLTRQKKLLLAVEPLLTLLILFTDRYHGLFYAGLRSTGTILDGGPWFWINAIYSYVLLLIALVLFVKMFLRTKYIFRNQAGVMVLGMLMPWLSNAIGILKISPFPQLDLTPFMFTISGAIFAFGLFRLHLLDIVPVARDQLVESMNDGVIVLDDALRIVDLNPAARTLLGLHDHHIGQPAETTLEFWQHLGIAVDEQPETQAEIQIKLSSSSYFEVRLSQLHGYHQKANGYLIILRDITDRKQTQMKLQQSEEQYRLLFENATEMIVVVKGTMLKFCNPITSQITGYSIGELTSSPFLRFVHPEDHEYVLSNHMKRLKGELTDPRYEFRLLTKDNQIKWAEVSGIRIDWEGEQATLNFLSDITDRKQAEMALQYQSTHDILTGLYNRQYFETELERLKSGRHFPVSLLMVDVDGLKKINDQFGHHAGDDLLRRAAEVMKTSFRPEDMIARIGGDEFVIIIPDADEETAQKAVNRLRSQVEIHNQTQPADRWLYLSIGSATGDRHHNLSTIFKQADQAMYLEKNLKKSLHAN